VGHEREDLGDEALLDAGVLGCWFRDGLIAVIDGLEGIPAECRTWSAWAGPSC